MGIRTIYIPSNKLSVIKEYTDPDTFTIGAESNASVGGGYAHIEDADNIEETIQRKTHLIKESFGSPVDWDSVDEIIFTVDPNFNDDEELQEYMQENEVSYDVAKLNNTYFDINLYDRNQISIDNIFDTYENLFIDEYSDIDDETIKQLILNTWKANPNQTRYDIRDLQYDKWTEVDDVQEAAKHLFDTTTEYYKGAHGFILEDGTIVLMGIGGDHNEITCLKGVETKWQFVEMGNPSIYGNCLRVGGFLTPEQKDVIGCMIRSYSDDEFYVSFFGGPKGEQSCRYLQPDYRRVLADIYRYYDEGIIPLGESVKKTPIFTEESEEDLGENTHQLEENVEVEVEDSEVDLSSFQKQTELNSKIWKNGDILNSKVRMKLLKIADDFWDFVNINWVSPESIFITGSICNYNWSKYSDIDLHLAVDFSQIDERTNFVQDYFDSKKNEWNQEHQQLKLYGFPVELYVQDINHEECSGGKYDLEQNAWIKHPSENEIQDVNFDKYEIKHLAAKIMTEIDDLSDELTQTNDSEISYHVGKKAHKLLNKIKKMRQYGLKRSGESDMLNIVYKCLRRTEYLDKLWKISSESYDKVNSIYETILHLKQALNEEVVADGNSEHNVYAQRWKQEREDLKRFLLNNGKMMTSKENGKRYFVYYDKTMSELIGNNYAICLQYNPLTNKPSGTVYIRALDKFTERLFTPKFDTRGRDNMVGTGDDRLTY